MAPRRSTVSEDSASENAASEDCVPEVSVVVVNWNTGELCAELLRTLYEREDPRLFEVVLVDNGSTDGSARAVRRAFGDVALVENGRNRGFAAAANQGARLARGRFVYFVNSDCLWARSHLEALLEFCRTHPEAKVVGTQLVDERGEPVPSCRRFPTPLRQLLLGSGLTRLVPALDRYRMARFDHRSARPVDQVIGAAFLVEREHWERLSGFDERFFVYYEEVDFCLRTWQAGGEVWYAALPALRHLEGQTTRSLGADKTAILWDSCFRYFHKHGLSLGAAAASLALESAARWLHSRAAGSEARRQHAAFRRGARWAWREHVRGRGYLRPHPFAEDEPARALQS